MRVLLAIWLLVHSALISAAPSGCIGNRVWQDTNRDGIQQQSEPGIVGVKVVLKNDLGNELDSAITKSRGYFSVCGPDGSARLEVQIPEDYIATAPHKGRSSNLDSDIDAKGIAAVQIVARKRTTHADVGLINKSVSIESAVKVPALGRALPATVPGDHTTPDSQSYDLRYGVWVEPGNAMPVSADKKLAAAFPLFDFAHVRGKSLEAVNGNSDDPEYVVNILAAARATNTALDLQLGSSRDYVWNQKTNHGTFSLALWKNAMTTFARDEAADSAIRVALGNGTIRYLFLIDEPHHSRWSGSWDGKNISSGNVNHVSNEVLDSMAAHVKTLWGEGVKTIVRSSPVRLIQARRGGLYKFKHLTHAYISPSPSEWLPGKAGPGRGFEWWLRQKDDHTSGLTNCNAYKAANLNMAVMLEWGNESLGNPYTGRMNWAANWWEGTTRYSYRAENNFIKAAPLEMDFIAKHFMIKRDPVTCKSSADGEILVDTIVSYRWDVLPADSGGFSMSGSPLHIQFHKQLLADVQSGNSVTRIGLPVGVGAD